MLQVDHIKFDKNDCKPFKTVSLLRYSQRPQPIGMYYLVVPYSTYSAKSNGELRIIAKLSEWDEFIKTENDEWIWMQNMMMEMRGFAPNGFEVLPRYNLVDIISSKNSDSSSPQCLIPMSRTVSELIDIVHCNFMDNQSKGSITTTTTTTSIATHDDDMKMDIDVDSTESTNIPRYVIRIIDAADEYIQPIQRFLQHNGLYSTFPDISASKHNPMSQREVLFVDKSGYPKKDKIPLYDESYRLVAQCDIGKNVVLGQYLGVQVLETEYEDIYDSTTLQNEYDLFQYNQSIDALQPTESIPCLEISIDAMRLQKQYRVDVPFLVMRDCESAIAQNVVFAKVFVNDWPAIFLLTTQQIKKGEELLSCYPPIFRSLSKQRYDTMRRTKKKRRQIKKIWKPFIQM